MEVQMKTLPIPDPTTRKKIMFYDTPQRQAQLKIQCQHDGLKQSEFFRLMVEGYINNNPDIVKFLHECKEKYSIQGKQKRTQALKLKKAGQRSTEQFSLDDSEINNIFDLLYNYDLKLKINQLKYNYKISNNFKNICNKGLNMIKYKQLCLFKYRYKCKCKIQLQL